MLYRAIMSCDQWTKHAYNYVWWLGGFSRYHFQLFRRVYKRCDYPLSPFSFFPLTLSYRLACAVNPSVVMKHDADFINAPIGVVNGDIIIIFIIRRFPHRTILQTECHNYDIVQYKWHFIMTYNILTRHGFYLTSLF